MSLGNRIHLVMKHKRLTQEELGEDVGYSGVSIGKLVNEKTRPKFDFFERLSEKHPDINLVWLITGEGEMLYSDVRGGGSFSTDEIIRLVQENEESLKESPAFMNLVGRIAKESNILESIQDDIKKLQKQIKELGSK